MRAKYKFISSIDTNEVIIDEDCIIIEAGGTIAQGYIGDNVSELINLLRGYGGIKFEREDLVTGHVGRGKIKEKERSVQT